MLQLLAVFGILLILAGITTLIIRGMVSAEDVYEDRQVGYGNKTQKVKVKSKGPKFLLWFNTKRSIVILSAGILLLVMKGMFFYAEAGTNYFVQYINGKQIGVTTAGYHPKYFGEVTAWKKYITVKTVSDDDEGVEFSGAIKPIPIRFVDQVTGDGYVSCRFQLPEDPEKFKKLALEFRTVENLLQSAIIPSIKELVKVTAYQFAAQDYISGNASEFNFRFLDQCENGMYATERIDGADTTTVAFQTDSVRTFDPLQQQYRVELLYDDFGKVIRKTHVINKVGLMTSQAIVENIELEDAFKERLKAQRDEAAKRQLEQQKTKTAIDERERILTQGETKKAEKKVEEEMAQVSTLIAIETKLKEEETNKKLAAIQLETQRLNAQTIKVKADADAYEITKKVHAGITPEKELEMRLDAQVKAVAELAKLNLPNNYIVTGASNGKSATTPIEALILPLLTKQLDTEGTVTGK